jgi:hydroxymethylpyrimidine/phosphomethylpyrimidine kinase
MAKAVKPPPCVLTIAGSDSGAGAGIQADARTIEALGGYALTAITAVTAQNGRGVKAWEAVAPRLIAAQLSAVLEGFPVAAVKTGLLPGAAAIRAIAGVLRRHPGLPLVVDPVIGSTSGTRFLAPAALRELRRSLLPLATLVTPNRPEAETLVGRRLRSERAVEDAARELAAEFGCAVLLKGGHAAGRLCRDCLAYPGSRVRWFESPRVSTRNAHGTGCVLSAAIAAELARGRALEAAVARARKFLLGSLRRNRRVRWGRGAGPACAVR